MKNTHRYVFVLLSKRFDETAATAFIASFRNAGMLTKTIGFRRLKVISRHGIVWYPDMTLHRALPLASRTDCLITPGPLPHLKQYRIDPELQTFINLAVMNAKMVITGQVD